MKLVKSAEIHIEFPNLQQDYLFEDTVTLHAVIVNVVSWRGVVQIICSPVPQLLSRSGLPQSTAITSSVLSNVD